MSGLWSMLVGGGAPSRWRDWRRRQGGAGTSPRTASVISRPGKAAPTLTDRSGIGERLGQPILCWNAKTGKSTEMAIVDKPALTTPPVLSVSRDGRRFFWNQTDHQDVDLVLIDNFK